MKIVFWHNYLMFHQSPYIRELGKNPGLDVYWVVKELLPSSYKSRGYPLPDTGNVKIIEAPTESQIEELLKPTQGERNIHIFFGIRNMPLQEKAFKKSLRYDLTRYIMSENRYESGWRIFPRWLTYTLDALRYGWRVDGIFCIGYSGDKGGHRWFRMCGYASEKIYPFIHTTEPHCLPIEIKKDETIELVFVGQMIHRKGIDTLLKALSTVNDYPWRLTLIGAGPQLNELKSLSQQLEIDQKTIFVGSLSNAAVTETISRSDILILPSRFDGWGAVVNEAILAGVPVICSDRCGAADIVHGSETGYVFKTDDIADLALGLRSTIHKNVNPATREKLREWSELISGKTLAEYFLRVVSRPKQTGKRHLAPWMAVKKTAEQDT